MSHIDTLLTKEAKAAVVRARIVKLAQEGYQIKLNLKYAQEIQKQEDVEKFSTGLDAVEQALGFHLKELGELGVSLSELEPTIEE